MIVLNKFHRQLLFLDLGGSHIQLVPNGARQPLVCPCFPKNLIISEGQPLFCVVTIPDTHILAVTSI